MSNPLEILGIKNQVNKDDAFAQSLFYFMREFHFNPLDEYAGEKLIKKGISLHLFNALNYVVDNLIETSPVTSKEAFDFLRTSITNYYDLEISTTTFDMQLFEMLNDIFDFSKQTPIHESKLLPRFLDAVNRYDNYLSNSNAHIIDMANNFYESLFKLFATCIGTSLSDFLYVDEKGVEPKETQIISQKLGGI